MGGSIPACAGEAGKVGTQKKDGTVYPRMCGGSSSSLPTSAGGSGLSPRVRGKRPHLGADAAAVGSIPACAGEAVKAGIVAATAAVYPRVCGGSQT